MKKLLALFFLLLAFSHEAAAQILAQRTLGPRTTTGTSSAVDLSATATRYHRLIFYAKGTVSTCQVKLEQSATGTDGWTDLIANTTCTSTGITATTASVVNYVRINLGTISGGGNATVVYQGFLTDPGAAVLSAGSAIIGVVGIDQSGDDSTNGVTPLDSNGNPFDPVTDPCDGTAKTFYVINTTTAATFEVANAVASNYWYICGVNIVVGAAQGVAFALDNDDGCGSVTAATGLNGGVTGATGWQFAANGGIALGNGSGTVMKSPTAGQYLCMVTSTTAQTSGTIAFVPGT